MKSIFFQIFNAATDLENDPQRLKKRLLIIETVRISFLIIITLLTILFQLKQPKFINIEIILPLYCMLAGNFIINSFYLFFIEKKQALTGSAFLFLIDTLFITGLIFYTDIAQPIFLFMYLVNIILCGFLFQKYGAFALSLLTSICFSLLLTLNSNLESLNLYLSLIINNLAFFVVAALSGHLSEQLNLMGEILIKKEKDIKILKNLNEMIVENITIGLMTVDKHFQIFHANKAALNILGREIMGLRLKDIHPKMERVIELHKTESNKKTMKRFEMNYINPKSEELLLGVNTCSIYDREGAFHGYVLIFEDLTQVKNLEKAMRRSEKLAAIGKLSASIAHEIRNPLASISGSIQLMKAKIPEETDEDARLMNITLKEIDRLNMLINDFLNFAKKDEERFNPIDINTLILECLSMIKMNKNLKANVEHKLELNVNHKIEGEYNKIKQVFLNLFINSYQAMETTNHPVLHVKSDLKPNGTVIVTVQDNGIGIPSEIQARLFEPFLTTKKRGTGLGLATVHKIIENHGGQIFVKSEVNKGTKFTLEFNRLEEKSKNLDNKSFIA